MSNTLKKHGFLPSVARLFTRTEKDAFDLIHFNEPELAGDDALPALACPDNWSHMSAEVLAERAALAEIPARLRTAEENTVPSWLWRRVSDSKATAKETSAAQIFTRIVGAAAYVGWKLDLFADESDARNFYDETRYALAQRFIAIEPKALATLGTEWAYGIKRAAVTPAAKKAQNVAIKNSAIDALLSKTSKAAQGKWREYLNPKFAGKPAPLEFTDVAADWGMSDKHGPHASIDLMACRHNDGSVNIEALQHATRLLVTLLDLHGGQVDGFTVGFHNFAPLLMALAIPYDSEAGRGMAAAISAVISAEAYAASATLAGLRGVGSEYPNQREVALRAMRNHRRAAYGDKSDYEKVSVIPAPLNLTECPDLPLVAAAQRRWDEALELAQQFGLRHVQITSLNSTPEMTLFTESMSQGVESVRSLLTNGDAASFVTEALARQGYNREISKQVQAHIRGARNLTKAPAINHTSLIVHGLDMSAIKAVEDYLPNVENIRLAFTPWILGTDFCRLVLKMSAAKLENPRFDLLKHLGFSDADVASANDYYYGRGSAKGATELSAKQVIVFERASEISAEAKIRMAASAQSFIAGDAGLDLTLPADMPLEKSEKLVLSAWRQGLKGMKLSYEVAVIEKRTEKKAGSRVSTFLHTKSPILPSRKARHRAGSRFVGMKPAPHKPTAKGRSK